MGVLRREKRYGLGAVLGNPNPNLSDVASDGVSLLESRIHKKRCKIGECKDIWPLGSRNE